MEDILRRLGGLRDFSWENLIHVIDILLVAYLIFRLISLIRSSRAWRILGGIAIFVVALVLSDHFQLRTLHWLLDKATLLAPVALVILLLPELRQTLEGFARLGLWPSRLNAQDGRVALRTLEEIVAATTEMSSARVGAIIVIERGTRLDDIAANGVSLQANISAPLLASIFHEGNPLHDGAALVRGDRIEAAACRLPLSETTSLSAAFHMRHRAGLGITEQADCLAVIVSEERGTISVCQDGQLQRVQDAQELRTWLNQFLRGPAKPEGRRSKRSKELVEGPKK